MKKILENKKRLLALVLFFTLILTITLQVSSQAQILGIPCRVDPVSYRVHYEKDQEREVTCAQCTVDSGSGQPIYDGTGKIVAMVYSVSLTTVSLTTQTCRFSIFANQSCTETQVFGGDSSCPESVIATGTGGMGTN
ncbi:hypothetical protein [Mucilaginibacter sp. UYCu711]|uniref:hypothetical protein n=1 Tax=Mucilaginibacter sp. UYCu711 TaxID=3156339 RepID=UPI003D1B5505